MACVDLTSKSSDRYHMSLGMWGFRRFQKERLIFFEKCAKTLFYVQKVRKQCAFAHVFALFPELAETPLFVQIDVAAVWVLWLDLTYTRSESQMAHSATRMIFG